MDDLGTNPIVEQIDPQEVIRLAQRLVALPSENPPGHEEPVARLIGEYLLQAGFKVQYQPIYPDRVNLLAFLPEVCPGPTLLFCGHTDTMPLSGSWNFDPHAGVLREGRLYGRGAADMKGGLAAMAAAAKVFARSPIPRKGTLIFAALIDEENKGEGAKALVRAGQRADWAIIGEPTQNIPVTISNGQVNFEFHLRGVGGHGSAPSKGHNAIYDGLLLIQALHKLAEEKFPARSHPLIGIPSINVGTIHGGVQTSIIPEACQITVDRRVVPGETVDGAIDEIEHLLRELQKENPGFDADMKVTYCLAPVEIAPESPVVVALRRATSMVAGRDPGLAGIRATTDAATLVHKGSIPTVIFGPGSLEQAHQPDEFLSITELVLAARIYTLVALSLLSQEV